MRWLFLLLPIALFGSELKQVTAKQVTFTDSGGAVVIIPLSLVIQNPEPRSVVQRNSSDTANIPIYGTAWGGQDIEARFNGGSWQKVATNVWGNFTGLLTNQAAAEGTFEARLVVNTEVIASKDLVGVGDVLDIGGQSNGVGAGSNRYSFTNTSIVSSGQVQPLTDHWAFLLDATGLQGSGSMWPLVARHITTNTGFPVGIVNSAVNGTSITEWLPGTPNFANLVRRHRLQPSGTIAHVWQQGETDAGNGMAGATYQANLLNLATNLEALCGIKTMPVMMATNGSGLPHAGIVAINGAMTGADAASASVLPPVNLEPLSVLADPGTPKVHLTSDTNFFYGSSLIYQGLSNSFTSLR